MTQIVILAVSDAQALHGTELPAFTLQPLLSWPRSGKLPEASSRSFRCWLLPCHGCHPWNFPVTFRDVCQSVPPAAPFSTGFRDLACTCPGEG